MGYFEYNIVNVLTFILSMGLITLGFLYIIYLKQYSNRRIKVMEERLKTFLEEQQCKDLKRK